MAEPAKPENDQYNLAGNFIADGEPASMTGVQPRDEGSPSSSPAATSRPRNPDGTFATSPPEAPKHTHSPRLRRLALDAGFTEEEVSQIPAAELRGLVQEATLERLITSRETREFRQEPAAPTAPEPPPESLAFEPPQGEYEPWVGSLVAEVKELRNKVKELEAGHGQLQGYIQQRITQSATATADAFFAQHPDIFGAGTFDEINKDSAEYARREALAAHVRGMKDKAPLATKLKKAMEFLFGFAAKKPAEPVTVPQGTADEDDWEKQWREGGLARPTHRAGMSEPTGEKKAQEAVAQYLRENGEQKPTLTSEFLK